MGLPVVTVLPDGNRAEVDSDVLGIARRLQEGDPSLNWPGEPSLALCYDHDHQRFEVWHTARDQRPYRVTHHPTCDAELIRKVVAADHTLGEDAFARALRENGEAAREAQRQWDDWVDNHIVPKSRFALRRDDGFDTRGQKVSLGTKR